MDIKKNIPIFDTHAHYDDERFDEDREEVLKNIRAAGVEKAVNIGCNMASSRISVQMAKDLPGFYAAVGIHPSDADEYNEESHAELVSLAESEGVVAIGEIGLDYYWDTFDHEVQKRAFSGQLEIARKLDLPVVIHSREAAADTFNEMCAHAKCLESEGKKVKGVIHCYSGSAEMAADYVKMGYFIGIGGVLTYKNARKTVEVVEQIPLESIVIETDCPYLTPVPNRGKRNDSSNLVYVIEKIAELKGLGYEETAGVLWSNAHRLYEL